MRCRLCIALGIAAVVLAGCGSGPTIITAEFEGRDVDYYRVDGNWLVYGWSPPVNDGRPIHLVARDLTTGIEKEIEGDWYGYEMDLENGLLVYTKRGGGQRSIVVYDLAAGTSTVAHRGQVSGLELSGTTLVWSTTGAPEETVIAIGSIHGGEPRILPPPPPPTRVRDGGAKISGNHVVFNRHDIITGVRTLMHHDLSSGITETIPIDSPRSTGYDLSGDDVTYRKPNEDALYFMNLTKKTEHRLVDEPYLASVATLNGDLLAWMSHMPPEEFKGVAGHRLIDHKDFRALNVLGLKHGQRSVLIEDRFMLNDIRITSDGRVFVLLPREVTASPSRIRDIVEF